MKRKRNRSRGEWAQLVREQAESGCSARKFCLERAIGLASFYQWRRRMHGSTSGTNGSRNGIETAGSFIDMGKIDPVGGGSTEASPSGWEVTLDLGAGLKLELRRA